MSALSGKSIAIGLLARPHAQRPFSSIGIAGFPLFPRPYYSQNKSDLTQLLPAHNTSRRQDS
jgi:hypothetical protein